MKNLKRFLTLFLALSMVLSMLSMTAFAAAGDPGTIKKVEIEADYDGVVTTDAKDGDVNFALNYSDATENGMYLVLVLSEEGVPKNGNILYVNQETADGEGVTFDNVYPMEIGEENSYIYMAGTDLSYDKVGTIIPNVADTDVIVNVIGKGEFMPAYEVHGHNVTVTYDLPCKLGYENADGTYTAIAAEENADGSYSYVVPEDINEVTVVVKGDVTGDGKVNSSDYGRLNAALLEKTTLTAVATFAADVTGDGKVNSSDYGRLNAVLLEKTSLKW